MVEEVLATATVDLEEAHVDAQGPSGGHLPQLLEQVAGGIFLPPGGGERRIGRGLRSDETNADWKGWGLSTNGTGLRRRQGGSAKRDKNLITSRLCFLKLYTVLPCRALMGSRAGREIDVNSNCCTIVPIGGKRAALRKKLREKIECATIECATTESAKKKKAGRPQDHTCMPTMV